MDKQNKLDAAFVATPGPVAPPDFKPSKYQQDIFDWIDTGTGNAVVEAVAGSGKTTTIISALGRMQGRVLFTAFNKHIANELATRAPAHAKVSTIHSLGMATLRKNHKRIEVDDRKLRRLVEEVYGDSSRATMQKRQATEQLVRLAKLTLTGSEDKAGLEALIDHYGIDTNGDYDEIIEAAPAVMRMALDEVEAGYIDFDDMVWAPTVLDMQPHKYDWVCIDEAQDLNAAQRALILRAAAGRVIAVGDRNQSIYGFAGADTDSIPTLISTLKAKTLPLSICYRCPASHVKLAKALVPQIEAREGAPKGVIGKLGLGQAVKQLAYGDLVVCRINKPLVEIAMGLIRQGKKAVVRGRDIGKGLAGLLERHRRRGGTLADTLARIADYRDREVGKLLKAKKESRAASLIDRVETIIVLCDGENTVDAVKTRIQRIFSDDAEGVVCSSVHKAKGLEANRVFIHLPGLMPFPKATEPWEVKQEYNLKYVALTRAKQELYMVE